MTHVPASSHGSAFALPTGFTFPDSDASTKISNAYETYLSVYDSATGGDIEIDSKYGVVANPSLMSTDIFGSNPGGSFTGNFIRFIGVAGSFKINKNGAPIIALTTIPADADLASGQVALWFDSVAPGALMVKAKDAGGVVRTATIPLT